MSNENGPFDGTGFPGSGRLAEGQAGALSFVVGVSAEAQSLGSVPGIIFAIGGIGLIVDALRRSRNAGDEG